MAEANEAPADALRRNYAKNSDSTSRSETCCASTGCRPTGPGMTSSTSSSTAAPSATPTSKACSPSTANCAPSSSVTKARPKSVYGPTSGAGQAPYSKHWKPAEHSTCKTDTPKPTRGPWTSPRPLVYPACTWPASAVASTPPTTACRAGIAAAVSTDSARGPETTGNNRHESGNPGTRTGHPTRESGGPLPARRLRESTGQRPSFSS